MAEDACSKNLRTWYQPCENAAGYVDDVLDMGYWCNSHTNDMHKRDASLSATSSAMSSATSWNTVQTGLRYPRVFMYAICLCSNKLANAHNEDEFCDKERNEGRNEEFEPAGKEEKDKVAESVYNKQQSNQYVYVFCRSGDKKPFAMTGNRYRFEGLGCSPIKVVRELGSERRETVRSISGISVRVLRGAFHSTRGPGRTCLWCTSSHSNGKRWVAMHGEITAESI